jgi:hypothetical protein
MSVEVSEEDDTDGVELLVFKLKAEGSDITVNDIPVLFATSTGGTAATLAHIANSVTLEIDGEEYSENTSGAVASTSGAVVTFDDLDITIDEGDTVTVVVKADVNDLDANFASGDALTASLTAVMVDSIDAEDQSGEDISGTDLTGTALGEEIAFYADGISVEFVSATETVSDVSDSDTNSRGTYVIKFNVTAFGENTYVDDSTGTSTDGVQWSITGGSYTGLASSNLNSTGDDGTGNFLVEDGQTEEFTLTVVLTNTQGTAGFYGIQIDEIGSGPADDNTANDTITTGLEDLETDQVNLQ